MQPIRITLLAAVILIAMSPITTACDPPAPSSQVTDKNPPQVQQTDTSTPPDDHPIIDSNLQHKLDLYNQDKTEQERFHQTAEPLFVDIIVILKQQDQVDRIVEFMKDHSTEYVSWDKGDETTLHAGGTNAIVNIELIPAIATLPGVIEIYEQTSARTIGRIVNVPRPTPSMPAQPKQPDGDTIIDTNLLNKIHQHNVKRARHERNGRPMEPVFVNIVVGVSHPDNVDDLVVFMKEHSLDHVYWDKGDGTTFPPGGASGYINIELVPTISLMPGIFSIHEITPSRPTGNPHQSTTPTTAQTPEAPTIEWTPPPPPTGPAVKPVVNTNLQRKLANHVENKANKRAASENLPTVYVELVITVQGPEHVDALVEFMNEHATGWVSSNKYDGTNRNVNGAIGRIDLDLVPTVEAMPGVIEIY